MINVGLDAARLFISGDYVGGMFGGVIEEDSLIVAAILTGRSIAIGLVMVNILLVAIFAMAVVVHDFRTGSWSGETSR